jgi:hypothetical protein
MMNIEKQKEYCKKLDLETKKINKATLMMYINVLIGQITDPKVDIKELGKIGLELADRLFPT